MYGYFIMDVNNSVTSIAFTKELIISGNRKMIKVGEIVGFGNGDFHYTNLTPALTCVVKKVHSRYALLNENDLRVKLLLEQYDPSTMVEVFEISSAKDADKISFLAGELIPHQATNTKFSDLFEKIVTNKQYQKWINTYFTTKETRANSQVSFNLSSFIEMLGKNAPSKITLDRIIKDSKDAKKGLNPSTISTAPNQIEILQPHERASQFAPPSNNRGHLENPEPEAIPEQLTDNTKLEESAPDAALNLPENQVEARMSPQEMQEVWDKQSNSKYTYAVIRERLTLENNNHFTKCLNEISPRSAEFSAFVQNAEAILGGKSHN
jgi:hypothetical protein